MSSRALLAGWSQQAYLKASNTDSGDQFGFDVALSADGSTLVATAIGENSNAAGINGDQLNNCSDRRWRGLCFCSHWRRLEPAGVHQGIDTGDRRRIWTVRCPQRRWQHTCCGLPWRRHIGPEAGAALVFTRSAGAWSQQAYLGASNPSQGAHFGIEVAISADGTTLAVGAIGENSNATGIDGNQLNMSASGAGAVYVFTRSGNAWSQQAYVKASNTVRTITSGGLSG